MSDEKTKGSVTAEVRVDQRDHYAGNGLYASQLSDDKGRVCYSYPGPTLLEAARVAGVEVKDGDEIRVTIEVVSRVFVTRRKP